MPGNRMGTSVAVSKTNPMAWVHAPGAPGEAPGSAFDVFEKDSPLEDVLLGAPKYRQLWSLSQMIGRWPVILGNYFAGPGEGVAVQVLGSPRTACLFCGLQGCSRIVHSVQGARHPCLYMFTPDVSQSQRILGLSVTPPLDLPSSIRLSTNIILARARAKACSNLVFCHSCTLTVR